jgi:hypothetical protein
MNILPGNYTEVTKFLEKGSEGKRPLGIPRRRWHDNIKMDLKIVACDNLYWIQKYQNTVK